MALSIKTDEADRLARELASLTGRSMTAVVTEALAEKLERERAKTSAAPIDRAALNEVLTRLRRGLDRRPVTKQEMDDLWGEGEDA